MTIVHDYPQFRTEQIAAIVPRYILNIRELELSEKRYLRPDVFDLIYKLNGCEEEGTMPSAVSRFRILIATSCLVSL